MSRFSSPRGNLIGRSRLRIDYEYSPSPQKIFLACHNWPDIVNHRFLITRWILRNRGDGCAQISRGKSRTAICGVGSAGIFCEDGRVEGESGSSWKLASHFYSEMLRNPTGYASSYGNTPFEHSDGAKFLLIIADCPHNSLHFPLDFSKEFDWSFIKCSRTFPKAVQIRVVEDDQGPRRPGGVGKPG